MTMQYHRKRMDVGNIECGPFLVLVLPNGQVGLPATVSTVNSQSTENKDLRGGQTVLQLYKKKKIRLCGTPPYRNSLLTMDQFQVRTDHLKACNLSPLTDRVRHLWSRERVFNACPSVHFASSFIEEDCWKVFKKGTSVRDERFERERHGMWRQREYGEREIEEKTSIISISNPAMTEELSLSSLLLSPSPSAGLFPCSLFTSISFQSQIFDGLSWSYVSTEYVGCEARFTDCGSERSELFLWLEPAPDKPGW